MANKKKKYVLGSDEFLQQEMSKGFTPIKETAQEANIRTKREKEEKKKNSVFSSFNDGYDFGDVSRTILKSGVTLGKATTGAFKKSSYFDNGYQFGDVARTGLATARDLGTSGLKGFFQASESISDWGYNKIGDIEWALGFENAAMRNWQTSNEDSLKSVAQSTKHILAGDYGRELSDSLVNEAYQKKYEQNKKGSIISRKGEDYAQEIARMATIAGYGSLTGGQAGTDLLFYASAAGNAENQARLAGATPEEAWSYSILSGTAEMLTEKMFGGLGKISDATGVSKGVAEKFTNKLTNKISSTFFRNLAEFGISATGEGFEEVASGFLDAYAQKLTYMKDSELKQLMKDQDLMEQFVQGTVTSFFMQTPNLIKSTAANVDYKTGYTKNEQKVVDQIIQERVNEASKNGEVSGKKYAEIRDKVNEELKSGDIKVRDIERILGGETYTNYQAALNDDSKLNQRLETLNKKIDEYENSSASEKLSKLNEYKQWESELEAITEAKNKSIENTSSLQRQLSSEVYKMAGKDSNFAKSYLDEMQKSVAFDKSQHDYDNLSDNKKALLDSAVNANANNTKSIHKLTQGIMDMMNDEDGFKYEFVNDNILRETGLSDQTKYTATSKDTLESIAKKNNMTVEQLKKLNNNISSVKTGQELNVYSKNVTNGLVIKKDNKILINLDAVNRLETVVGHELTHLIEKIVKGKASGDYGNYRKALFEYAEKKGDLEKIREEFARLYKDQNLTQEELDQEITAELSGRYLFGDEKFLKLVAENRANTKIRDFIDDLVTKFTGTEEEQQLRELQKKYRDAYQNRNKSFKESQNSRDIQLSKFEKGRKFDYNIGEQVEGEQLVQLKSYGKNVVNDTKNYYLVDNDGLVLDKIKNIKKNKDIISVLESEYNGRTNEVQSSSEDIAPVESGLSDSESNLFQIGEEGWINRYLDYLSEKHERNRDNRGKDNQLSKSTNELNDTRFSNDIKYSLNSDAIQNLADITGESYSMLEANLGNDDYSVKNYLTRHTKLVDKYMKDNNITVEPVMKSINLEQHSQEYRDFVKNNDISVLKLANDENLLNEFFELERKEFGDLPETAVNNIIENQKELFELAKNINETPNSLKRYDREFNYIINNTQEIVDDTETDRKIQKEVIDSPKFQKYLDKLVQPLFHKEAHTVEEVMEEAKYNHGTTNNYEVGAYMTTDGELLDFGDHGYRDDHRTVDAFDLDMNEFMEYGAIRMKPESNGFELAQEPTPEQYSKLYDYIDDYCKNNPNNGDIVVDVDTSKNNYDSQFYNINTPTSKIINDIKEYYKTGSFPKQSEFADFRYSLSSTDNQGRELTPEQQEYFKDSKVRDDEGKLMEVYHGTNADFNTFERGGGEHGEGYYFTEDYDYADEWSGGEDSDNRIVTAYLNLSNPLSSDVDLQSESMKKFIDGISAKWGLSEEDIKSCFEGSNAWEWSASLGAKVAESMGYGQEDVESIVGFEIDDPDDLGITDYNAYLGSYAWENGLNQLARESGFDGIIAPIYNSESEGLEYIAFNSNQIKNVDNTNPTSNPDIRYSLSPSGEMVDNTTGEKVTLEASEEGNSGTLMVLHNLGESKFNGILDLDGIPVPSIAVTNPNIIDHNQFGEGTLIFDKSTIDPAIEANEVYDRDVWSPTISDNIQIDYELNDDAIETAADNLGIEEWRLRDAVENNSKPEYLIERLLREEKLIDKYVADNNIKYETAYKDAETSVDMHQSGKNLRQFIRDNDLTVEKLCKDNNLKQKYFDEIKKYYDESTFPQAVKENLYKEKIDYLNNWIDSQHGMDINSVDDIPRGLRKFQRDFDLIKSGDNKVIDEWQTEKNKKQAAIDNGIEDYLKEQTKDVYGEKGIRNDVELFTNSGNRRSFWALHDEYNLDNLVEALTKGETTGTQHWGSGYGQIQATMANRFNSISDIKANEALLTNLSENNEALENAKANIDSDIEKIEANNDVYYDTVAELLVDFARGDLTIDNFRKLTRNDYQTVRNVSDSLIEKIIDDMNSLKNLPTDYFEAKPQRAVGLDEIQMAVIPNNWSAETKQRLTDKGIKYTEYDPSIEGDRQRVINQFDDLKFSLSDPNNIAPIGAGTYSQDVKLQETQMDRIESQLAELTNTLDRINNNIPQETNVDVDGFDLNLEPFMDMINGSTQAESDMKNVTQTRKNIENNLKLINDNFDKVKSTLVEQGMPIDAAQDFIENTLNKYDKQYRETLNKTGKSAKIEKMILDAQEKWTNRNAWIDKLSKDSGNENIKLLGDMANNSFKEASTNINKFQTDLNGKKIGKGIKDIFEPYRKEGLLAVAEDYLFNRSNIERHKVGKGSTVPLEVSQRLVKDYLTQYPQLKNLTKDIQNYYDNLLTQEVKSGLIDQDTYNLLRGEKGIYRSYVPFYPSDAEKRYFDNQGNLKPAQTLKRARGGASKIMGIQDAMGKQTMAVWNSIRTNQLYQEIINTVGGEEGLGSIIRNDPTNLSQSLYTDSDGNRFLTAFVDGQERTAQISEDLFNELNRNGENRIKDLEEKYSAITKPLQWASNLRRNLLTSYNPTFALFKNPVKDIQDAILYSKHTADMLKNLPSAYKELWTGNTETVQQFMALYGSGEFTGIGKGYARVSEMIELAPRYAEFKASLQNGDSVAKAIYNARDITTNFGRGGYITKAMNRNGFTFLNASVQGFSKFVRNFSEQPNARQFAMAVGKAALLGIAPAVVNELAFGSGDDKDEDYEALPDYIKDNYYIFKLGDNADYDDGNGMVISVGGSKFLRIPKGRALSVMGSAARRAMEYSQGDENAFEGYLKNAWSQVGPVEISNNPLDNTIFAPIAQVMGGEKTSGGNTAGRAWYGGDIVPTRLQGEKPEDQYDASIDKMSIWLGDKLGISPYKINYVLDQYSGGIGDALLPMFTEETKNGAETPLDYLIAPVRDQLIVNSIDDNKYASEFYSTKEKLYKGSKATDEDKIRSQYMDDVSWDMSSLYKEKRAIQSDSSLSKKEKYAKVQAVQKQINDIAKVGLNMSKNIDVSGSYASVGDDRAYYKNAKGNWTPIDQKDLTTVESLGMTDAEKSNYFDTSNALYNIYTKYQDKKQGKSEEEQKELNKKQKKERLETIKNSPLSDNAKYALYDKSYDDKLLPYYEDLGFKANDIMTYKEQTFTADKDKNGKTISNSKKRKVVNYISDMNIPEIQKIILYKKEYKSDTRYDRLIFNYVDNSNMDYSSKKKVLQELGINVK